MVTTYQYPSCFCLCSFCFWRKYSYNWIWNYISRNCLLGHRKKIAKFFNEDFYLPLYLPLCSKAFATGGLTAKSIEWFIEDQAFLLSYDLAPPPRPPSLYSTVSKRVSLSQSSCVSPVELTDGEGRRGWVGSHNSKKAWSSINYSILSALQYPFQAHRALRETTRQDFKDSINKTHGNTTNYADHLVVQYGCITCNEIHGQNQSFRKGYFRA